MNRETRFAWGKIPAFLLAWLLSALALIPGICFARADGAASDAAFPYSSVYEPETSWSMSATVAWEADSSGFLIRRIASEKGI